MVDSSSIAASGEPENLWSRLARIPNLGLLALAAFLIGVSVTLMHRPFAQPEGGDEAIWDYVAQCILRGQAPYRDVVEIKSPLSAYLSAAAMLIGRSAGLRDVIAVRLLNVLMVGLLSATTFLLAAKYLRSRWVACIAFLIPLVPTHFTEWMVTGTEPKLPMILFGLFSLLLIARGKPFWAGFFSMLSCLCWQPGLMFTGVALLMFSRYLTNWRDLAALKVLLGAVVPLAVLLLYFYSIGALADLWTWTVVYNLRVYAPETAKGLRETVALLWKVAVRVFRLDLVLIALSVAGLIMFGIERVRTRLKDRKALESPCLFGDAIVILPLIYLAFCLINFQSGPDLIPLFPFIGLFAGWFVVTLGGARFGLARYLPAAALILLFALIIFRALIYRVESELTLQDQEKGFAAISKVLAPDDGIYVHGTVEILVLLNRPNLNPYIFLDRGKDDWIVKRTRGNFGAIIDEMESSAPKLVAISRTGKVAHRAELRRWVDDHYDQMDLPGYEGIYLRRQQ
jgi:hypothetical protein